MEDPHRFLKEALKIAEANARSGKGGPFGAVIVQDGKIICSGSNIVTVIQDPTAHAEIVAIRKACKKLKTFDLEGCELYTSCYPCPMCLGAIYWAGIRKVYYANTSKEAAAAGFDDRYILKEMQEPDRQKDVKMIHLPLKEDEAFQLWRENKNKIPY